MGFHKIVLSAAASIVVFAGSAAYAADDPQAVWKEIVARAKNSGIEITWDDIQKPAFDTIEVQGVSIVPPSGITQLKVERVKAKAPQIKEQGELAFEVLELTRLSADGKAQKETPFNFALASLFGEGVKFSLGKDYRIDKFNMAELLFEIKDAETGTDSRFTMENLSGNGWYYPDFRNVTAPITVYRDAAFNLNNFEARSGGKPILLIPTASSVSTCNEALTACQGAAVMEDAFFRFNTEGMNEKIQENLKSLGLEDGGTFSVAAEADWNSESGDLNITKANYTINDIGALNISGQFKGITQQIYNELRRLNRDIALQMEKNAGAGNQQPDPTQQAEMMNLLAQLMVANLSLRFDDKSITNKLLEMQARKQGGSREELAQSLPMMAGIMLAKLEAPEFSKATTAALQTYFADPGNLTITINPDQPVSVGQIIGTAMATPPALIQLLNLKVSSNE